MTNMEKQNAIIDGVPLCWYEPTASTNERRLAVWLTGFSGTKESVDEHLRELATRGYVAVSFDPYQHGERAIETREELSTRVIGNMRLGFWPILAHSTEDVPRVIDWAQAELGVSGPVCMGGISMGGDISVAAAGLDRRIECVAAGIATPDWLRPGSHLAPGEAEAEATQAYERRNPMTHLELYAHCPAISFQIGEFDTLVPPDGARRFADALAETYAECPRRLEVCVHKGVEHAFTDAMWRNSLEWFEQHVPVGGPQCHRSPPHGGCHLVRE